MITSLFIVEGHVAKPSPHVLLLEPFKSIWEKDKSESKSKGIQIFSYIEFYVSPLATNPFSGYVNDNERHHKICSTLGLGNKWKPGPLTQAAVKQYTEWIFEASVSMKFLESVESAVSHTMEFLSTVNLNEKTERGMPVYKPQDILRAAKESKDVLITLKDLKENVIKELYESDKAKGNAEINPFEK